MIIADENIDHTLIEAIRAAGIETDSVYETRRGIRDEVIIEASRNPPRIILTEDKDFGEWVFAHHVTDISVVFLRYDFRDTGRMKEILVKLFINRIEDLIGCFTTITVDKIRIRRIRTD
ncbi:DUF5615 family PIN-like protein [Larkinella insperata]|uniref:DUF5615 family PIN-like protein n=1 Tax=Larkinella insperata TaxID=332158 RepID=A0ABW3QIZ6_9BACT|nr:DUF5615 family PIN-like protein [Larkinella insperata]